MSTNEFSLISTEQLAALVAGSVEYGGGYRYRGSEWSVPGAAYAPARGRWIDGDATVARAALRYVNEVFCEYSSQNFEEVVAYRRHPVIQDAWVSELVWQYDWQAERWAEEVAAIEAEYRRREIEANRRFDQFEHVHGRAHRTLVYS